MAANIKDKILEFVSIAKACPDNLQEKCFELLLKDFLDKQKPHVTKKDSEIEYDKGKEDEKKDEEGNKQDDIEEKDLHVKTKRFLKSYSVTITEINQIFYKQGDEILPLFDDLKTTKASESQLRLAMLHTLKNAIHSGDFEFNGEEVREECQIRKCYDAANYTAIFKKNNSLFDNFDKYDKKNPTIRLSSDGKKELANIIKDLQ